jgi:hypothetical protein
MAKRKYARHSDVHSKNYECTKRKCKWQGTIEEQAIKKVDECQSTYVCPKCGNDEFYNLL